MGDVVSMFDNKVTSNLAQLKTVSEPFQSVAGSRGRKVLGMGLNVTVQSLQDEQSLTSIPRSFYL